MKSLQDTLYNWLTIKVVADVRKEDSAAQDTAKLFYDLLVNDHGLKNIRVKKDEEMYFISYLINDEEKTSRFPIEVIDVMLNQMEAEPHKFINYNN